MVKAFEHEKRVNPESIMHLFNNSNSTDEFSSFCAFVIKKTELLKLATIDSQNEFIEADRKDNYLIKNRINEKWGRCFELSTILRVSVSVLTNKHLKRIENDILKNENTEKLYTFSCLKHLVGRAIQVYAEIMCLVENGFPDAALARWRTLYEITCYAEFINNNGEHVAKAFLEYDNNSNNNKWANKAKCFTGKDFVSTKNIEDQCDFSKSGWSDVKDLACLPIHVGVNGTIRRIGLEMNKPIPIGPVEDGITLPATQAAYMLGIISTIFLSLSANADSASSSFLIYDLVEKTVNDYYRVFNTLTDGSTN
ncbi:MAG: hypothetical protein IKI03_06175 [Clostridia bacterium]|nr:hypothetical protein [Clostridia bacterium]